MNYKFKEMLFKNQNDRGSSAWELIINELEITESNQTIDQLLTKYSDEVVNLEI